jgi:hypothetical protein
MYCPELGEGNPGNLSPNIVLKDVQGLEVIRENKGLEIPPTEKSRRG